MPAGMGHAGADDRDDARVLPSFNDNIAAYRDYRLRARWHYDGVPKDKKTGAVARLVNHLSGEAWESIKKEEPSLFSESDGFERYVTLMDKRFGWRPESILQDAISGYLDLPAMSTHDTITRFVARFRTREAQFVSTIEAELQKELDGRYDKEYRRFQEQSVTYMIERQ
eukprot:557627-Alexandrium_andersonii.AAC.1